jgi:IPT/TIG domain-containing protein
MRKRSVITTIAYGALPSILCVVAIAQSTRPEILRISPTSGPEGSHVEITGKNLQDASAVFLGATKCVFSIVSPEQIIMVIPHKSATSTIVVSAPLGSASSPFSLVVSNDPRVPDEVSYKAGYVNPVPPPRDFNSALLWGIAIADTRVPGYQSAAVEIASTQLTCRVDGKGVILNDDSGNVRGGLYRRGPWFGTDQHDPMPVTNDAASHAVVLAVGRRPDRVWHFWSPSPRAALPPGDLEGCTVKARVRISQGALLQMGMDYWRTPTVAYGPGGNNHEAGASNWYFPSGQWQEAVFTDIGGPQF